MFEILDSQFPALNSQPTQANQFHWELRKSGCAFRRSGSTALLLRTVHAGMARRANVDPHKAARRFVFSTSHFAAPMSPAYPPGARRKAGPSADAIVARQRSSISTDRAWTKYRDQRQATPEPIRWSSPMGGTAVDTCKQKEAATLANRGAVMLSEAKHLCLCPLMDRSRFDLRFFASLRMTL